MKVNGWLSGLFALGLSASVWANGWGQFSLGEDPLEDRVGVRPDTAAVHELIAELHLRHLRDMSAAQLAVERSRSPRVRAYADRVLRDLAFADHRLRRIAEQSDINLDAIAGPGAREVPSGLVTAAGTDFDELFLRWMREGHRAAMESMRRLLAAVERDTDLGVLTARMIPIVEQHGELASRLTHGELSRYRTDDAAQGG